MAILLIFAMLCGLQSSSSTAQDHPVAQNRSEVTIVTPDGVVWRGDPKGMQTARIGGDPQKEGEQFTLWLRMPAGFVMKPHWHPVDENLVVIKGRVLLGTGEHVKAEDAKQIQPDTFVQIPKTIRHYAIAQDETVLQVYGVGPFVTYWVEDKK